ncbi:hypothetical protein M1494_00660 [Candidatus Parvarchaeota archaeon]|nr:hypothetical protein [Candidatus Parvarchaeota archaeon]
MKKRDKRLLVILKALWIYFTLLWAYIAVENLVYPAAVYSTNFSVYIPIRTDLLGLISFALSFIFYIVWKLQEN